MVIEGRKHSTYEVFQTWEGDHVMRRLAILAAEDEFDALDTFLRNHPLERGERHLRAIHIFSGAGTVQRGSISSIEER